MVIVPHTGELLPTPEVLDRFGAFLREITGDAPTASVHATIVEHCELPDHDPRIDTAIADPDEFAAIWSALTAARMPPRDAWEAVVLPVVVAFSNDANFKVHLELATSFWVAATQRAGTLTEYATVPIDPTFLAPEQPAPSVEAAPSAAPVISRPRVRPWLLTAGTVVVALIAALLWWWGSSSPSTSDTTPSRPAVRPSAQGTATPSTTPAPLPSDAVVAPPVSTLAAPSPTWTGPGPTIAPGVPTALAILDVTMKTISFSWQPPSLPGTGGIAYYRITVNGQDGGWTTQTSVTLGGLTPATSYTISVTAFNNAGLGSPPSNTVTATTTPPPTTTAPLSPTVAIAPSNTIPLGDSFTVSGADWTCDSPAQVEVLLQGKPIAQTTTDDAGAFTVPVAVMTDQATPYVLVIGSGEELELMAGPTNLVVRLVLGQAQCSTHLSKTVQITFT